MLSLRWILEVFGPSTQTHSKYNFRHLGVDQQYLSVFCDKQDTDAYIIFRTKIK
jgi:hypothetical protein